MGFKWHTIQTSLELLYINLSVWGQNVLYMLLHWGPLFKIPLGMVHEDCLLPKFKTPFTHAYQELPSLDFVYAIYTRFHMSHIKPAIYGSNLGLFSRDSNHVWVG